MNSKTNETDKLLTLESEKGSWKVGLRYLK